MAKQQNVEHGTSKSLEELKAFEKAEKQRKIEDFAKKATQSLALLDLQNPPQRTYTVYSKSQLRTYLKNPLSETNQASLRQVSQFLYVLSAQYRRLVAYFASQIDVTAYSVIPNVSLIDKNDAKKLTENYEQTLRWLASMNLQSQIFSILTTCWREDAFFGYIYYNDASENWDQNSFYILPLEGKYCRISSTNIDGTLNCAFDFSYFTGSNEVYLEYWDKEFTTKYNTYKNDSKQRWQELDPERTFVIKTNYDQLDRIIPPLASLFESIIDLVDKQGLVADKDALDMYKLLVMELETIEGSDEPNDWKVDLDTALAFYQKASQELPDQVGMILSPTPITPVTFDKNMTADTNEISKANSNLWEAAGVSQLMDSNLSGSTAVKNAIIFDGLYSTRPLRGQIEARINRFLDYVLTENKMRLKYIDVTPYTKADVIEQYKEAASLGVNVKLAYASLLGYTPLDMIGLSFLENDLLQLQDQWQYPLVSSHTQSSSGDKKSGGQTKNIGDLTDEGAATRDGDKNTDS